MRKWRKITQLLDSEFPRLGGDVKLIDTTAITGVEGFMPSGAVVLMVGSGSLAITRGDWLKIKNDLDISEDLLDSLN